MDETASPRLGIRFVIALPCEAKPLIAKFGLHPLEGRQPYPIYHDENRLHWLIVTGVGRQAASVGTAYLAGLTTSGKSIAWLNIGVAGHATLPLGEARVAHKITDVTSGTSHFPPVILQGLPTESLVTVTQPEKSIPSQMLVDMEGSAFYAAASTFSSPELVHCLKVVSDHGTEQRLAKEHVTSLVEGQLSAVEAASEQLLELSSEFAARWADPAYFDAILGDYHFTATQKNQLRRLLQRWQVLLGDEDVAHYVWKHAATASEALASLKERLSRIPLVVPQR